LFVGGGVLRKTWACRTCSVAAILNFPLVGVPYLRYFLG